MAQGKAKRITYKEVDFFDWNRYNMTTAAELSEWVSSFNQNINEFFSIHEEGKLLQLKTPVGEHIPVMPGSVIIRDASTGQYFSMNAISFSENYGIVIEEKEEAAQ